MSDNFSPNATTNAAAFVFSADEVGTETSGKPVLVTRVKVQHGPDGSATDVSSASRCRYVTRWARLQPGKTQRWLCCSRSPRLRVRLRR